MLGRARRPRPVLFAAQTAAPGEIGERDAVDVVWACDDQYHLVYRAEAQDAQTNIPPMMPTQLWDRNEDTARGHEWRKSDGPDKELSKRSGPLDERE